MKYFFKKNLLLSAMILLLILSFLALIGCDSISTVVYNIEGTKDISISADITEYDFLSGVSGKKTEDGNIVSENVTADSSSVIFCVAGEYKIVYKCGTASIEKKVFIYGNPIIICNDIEVIYIQANSLNIAEGITAVDSFGKTLEIIAGNGFEKDSYGRIKYGAHIITYSATDALGNIADDTRIINVTKGEAFEVSDLYADLFEPTTIVEFGGYELLSVWSGSRQADTDEYIFNNGYVMLKSNLIKRLGTGEFDLTFNFAEGYADCRIIITDNAEPDYTLEEIGDDLYLSGEAILLPAAQKGEESAQNITVEYKVFNENGEQQLIENQIFTPVKAGIYTYAVNYIRNNEIIKTLEQDFEVISQEDYYGRNFAASDTKKYWTQGANITQFGVVTDAPEGKTAFKIIVSYTTLTDSGIIFDRSLYSQIISAGYTQLSFMYYVSNDINVEGYSPADGNWVTAANGLKKDIWAKITINLANISEVSDFRISINGTNATMYIADMYFFNADKVNAEGNLISSKNLLLWIPGANVTEYTLTENAPGGMQALKFTVSQYTTLTNSGITLNSNFLKRAIDSGYTQLRFMYYVSNDINVGGFKSSDGNWVTTGNGLKIEEWAQITVNLSNITENLNFNISVNGTNATMYVKDMYLTKQV